MLSEKLTPKMEAFVSHYLQTNNATMAYRTAYNTSAKPAVVNVAACKLLKHPKVAARIEALRHKVQDNVDAKLASAIVANEVAGHLKGVMNLDEHLHRLADLADKAEKDGKWAAAIAAEVKRGEALGFYVQRSVNVNQNYAISDTPVDDADEWAAQFAGSAAAPN